MTFIFQTAIKAVLDTFSRLATYRLKVWLNVKRVLRQFITEKKIYCMRPKNAHCGHNCTVAMVLPAYVIIKSVPTDTA